MNLELQALEDNQTWEVVDLPPGKSTIGCKWVKLSLNQMAAEDGPTDDDFSDLN